jgi:hypothetical protein
MVHRRVPLLTELNVLTRAIFIHMAVLTDLPSHAEPVQADAAADDPGSFPRVRSSKSGQARRKVR